MIPAAAQEIRYAQNLKIRQHAILLKNFEVKNCYRNFIDSEKGRDL